MSRMSLSLVLGLGITVVLPVSESWGIGRKDFFEQLQQSWNSIRTFQAEVHQESQYSDGLVQIYEGSLALGEDGSLAYDYKLKGEFENPDLIPEEEQDAALSQHTDRSRTHASGAYRARGNLVNHFVSDQNLIIESTEDETILIKVFRNLLGGGDDFNLDEFIDQHSIKPIEESRMADGTPVYRMIAKPKRGNAIRTDWTNQAEADYMTWNQELWVERDTLKPIKAILITPEERTSVRLSNAIVNQPLPEHAFQLQLNPGDTPRKIRRSRPPAGTFENQSQSGFSLPEIPAE